MKHIAHSRRVPGRKPKIEGKRTSYAVEQVARLMRQEIHKLPLRRRIKTQTFDDPFTQKGG